MVNFAKKSMDLSKEEQMDSFEIQEVALSHYKKIVKKILEIVGLKPIKKMIGIKDDEIAQPKPLIDNGSQKEQAKASALNAESEKRLE